MIEPSIWNEWAVIGYTLVGGLLLALVIFLVTGRKQKVEDKKEEKKEERFSGKMNTSGLKKVIFSPEVCENELPGVITPTDSESNTDENDSDEVIEEGQEDEEEEEEEEEEQMPQFNKRKIKNAQNFDAEIPSTSGASASGAQEMSDADKMNFTIGKLHGKLATAQLKAKTRQIASEMSEQERETEAKTAANQMESIMRLMMENQEKFGMTGEDIEEQMKLYKF